MHITVYCPACKNRYQLHEEMRGKRMRCVNALCREVFEVREEGDAGKPAATVPTSAPTAQAPGPPSPPGKGYTSGCIGDMVPLVTAEAADEPPASAPLASSSVGDLVPPVSAEAAKASPAPAGAPTSWKEAPPPVRRKADTMPASPATAAPVSSPAALEMPARQQPPAARQTAAPAEWKSEPATASPAPADAPAWAKEPPPVRKPVKSADSPAPVPPATSGPTPKLMEPAEAHAIPPHRDDSTEGMIVSSPGAWQPPPVRGGGDVGTSTQEADVSSSMTKSGPATRRFGGYFVAFCLLLIVGAGGVAVYQLIGQSNPEEELRLKAAKEFDQGDAGSYRKAAADYATLAKSFPDSPRLSEYEFARDLSALLIEATNVFTSPDPIKRELDKFVAEKKDYPQLAQAKPKLWEVYDLLIRNVLGPENVSLIGKNLEELTEFKRRADLANTWMREAESYWPEKVPPRSLQNRIDQLRQNVERERKVVAFVAVIDVPHPSLEEVEVYGERAKVLELDNDPRVKKKLAELVARALPSVQYQPRGWDMPFRAGGSVAVTAGLPGPGLPIAAGLAARLSASMLPPPEVVSPGLLVGPRLGPLGAPPNTRGVVFAVARGVLYALAEHDGRILWATRVGIDTARLPVRVPATQVTPEIVLVLSSDTNTLTARRVGDGAALWQQHLPAPCLGNPVVVEREIQQPEGGIHLSRRAYVGTVNGRVLEIEVGSGHVLGEYVCKLPLLVGGAREQGTTLLYFPSDRGYVFVLDVALQKCLAVLRTGHPSGSLRGEPVLASEGVPASAAATAGPRYLILSQTSGLEQMKLRAWELPIDWRTFNDKPAAEYAVRGWSWFEPYADGEKIALTTDAGVLGLYGVKQRNNNDKALFPLLGEGRDTVSLGVGREPAGRTQIVHGTERDFWVLAQGEMQQWRLGIDREKGLMVGSKWPQPLPLGSALHAGQVNASGDTLFVVTQSPGRHTCLVTAVDASSGDIRWQRQLGLLCTHDPATIGGQVVALDQSGGLFLFDPAQAPHRPGFEWQAVQEQVLAPPLGSGRSSQVFAGSDGAVYVIAQAAKEILLRRYLPGKKANEPAVQTLSFPAIWTGTPAFGGGQIIVPLTDGTLARFALAKDSRPDGGPDWRALDADAGAPGHVVHLTGDDYLYTDGSNRLHRLRWPAGSQWTVPDKQKLQLPPLERIVAAPLVLPAGGKAPPRVLVADASGTLTLLAGDQTLQKIRAWPLSGRITAGPFRRGGHVGCVVDEHLLVWINPEQQELAWSYRDPGGAAIVGQPQRLGERIVVALRNGRFVSLDAATGQPRGKGYALRASAAPAAAAVAFGADRVFAPLTDGTVLLLPLEDLERR